MVLETMIEYLESNLFCEIDYAELAKRAHYGKDNAARIFSASTDFTLAEYVRVRRLSEAGKRLSAGVGSIADTLMIAVIPRPRVSIKRSKSSTESRRASVVAAVIIVTFRHGFARPMAVVCLIKLPRPICISLGSGSVSWAKSANGLRATKRLRSLPAASKTR